MTNYQVLELNLSEAQFEDLSDEMASTIQGGTGDENGGNGENGDLLEGTLNAFGDYLENLLEGNLDEANEQLTDTLDELF